MSVLCQTYIFVHKQITRLYVHKNVNQETPHKNATTRNKTKVETPKFEWFGVSYIQKQTLCV